MSTTARQGKKPGFLERFAHRATTWTGSSWAFALALLVILVWAVTGPFFDFSDTWQLVINTGTTIVTFLMVFVIQNAQNRDAKAVHIKLDELIRAVQGARNNMLTAENLTEEQQDREIQTLIKTAKREARNAAAAEDLAAAQQHTREAQQEEAHSR